MLFELMHGDVAVASVDLEEVTGVMVHAVSYTHLTLPTTSRV